MGGIGLQQLFIIVFLFLTIKFHLWFGILLYLNVLCLVSLLFLEVVESSHQCCTISDITLLDRRGGVRG